MGLKCIAFEKYTDEICSQIKCSEVHNDIKEELTSHLEEIRDDYVSKGMALEEAEKLAIEHMGDSEQIGFELDKVYKKTPEYKSLIITFILITFGIITQLIITENINASYTKISKVHILSYNALGILAAIALYFFDYRKIEKYSRQLFLCGTIFIVITLMFGSYINGVKRLAFFGSVMDASFIGTIIYTISLCGILPKFRTSPYGKTKTILIYILCSILILLTKNIYYVILFIAIAVFMLIYLKFPKPLIGIFTLIILFSILCFVSSAPYRLDRVRALVHFMQYKDGSGYPNYMLHKLFSSPTIFGNGVSEAVYKILPNLTSNFILCYIIYAFGWATGIVVLAIILAFIVNLFTKTKAIKNSYGKVLFSVISVFFALEFLQAVLMNFNLSPVSSMTAPFISYSGYSAIINIALIGLINSIYSRKNLRKSLSIQIKKVPEAL